MHVSYNTAIKFRLKKLTSVAKHLCNIIIIVHLLYSTVPTKSYYAHAYTRIVAHHALLLHALPGLSARSPLH